MNYESMLPDLRSWNASFGGGVPTKADIEAAMRGEADEETRSLMAGYSGKLERRTISKTADSISSDEWTLDAFRDVIEAFLNSVPAECRASATVELKGGYDKRTELVVQYNTLQTDEEWGLDVARALMSARKQQAADAATYRRLSKKFAGKQEST